MSKWRSVWREAIRASGLLAVGSPEGGFEFRQLLEEYPSDAMIFYERGEAYEYLATSSHKSDKVHEYLEQLALAESDYKLAKERLVEPHWIQAAEDALASVVCSRNGCPGPRARFLRYHMHRLHQLPQLPHDVRADAMSAVARFDSEPRLATADLGVCLERLVWIRVQQAHLGCSPREDLAELVKCLAGHVPDRITTSLDQARVLRNDAMHARQATDKTHFEPILNLFLGIATWFCESQVARRPFAGGDNRSKVKESGRWR